MIDRVVVEFELDRESGRIVGSKRLSPPLDEALAGNYGAYFLSRSLSESLNIFNRLVVAMFGRGSDR